jgi:hypothetical protein
MRPILLSNISDERHVMLRYEIAVVIIKFFVDDMENRFVRMRVSREIMTPTEFFIQLLDALDFWQKNV